MKLDTIKYKKKKFLSKKADLTEYVSEIDQAFEKSKKLIIKRFSSTKSTLARVIGLATSIIAPKFAKCVFGEPHGHAPHFSGMALL